VHQSRAGCFGDDKNVFSVPETEPLTFSAASHSVLTLPIELPRLPAAKL
jgi:hypothetical protein